MFHIHVCLHSFPHTNNKLAAWSIPAHSCPIAPRLLSRDQVAHRPVQCCAIFQYRYPIADSPAVFHFIFVMKHIDIAN